jgi:hypothetical protein
MFGDFKGKLNDRYLQGPEETLPGFQELRENITFEGLQMGFESRGDRFRWPIEYDGESFRK